MKIKHLITVYNYTSPQVVGNIILYNHFCDLEYSHSFSIHNRVSTSQVISLDLKSVSDPWYFYLVVNEKGRFYSVSIIKKHFVFGNGNANDLNNRKDLINKKHFLN